jgi:hypothetical protein
VIWRNKDPALDTRMKKYIENTAKQYVDVYMSVSGLAGEPLKVEISTTPISNKEKIQEKNEIQDLTKPYYLRTKKSLVSAAYTKSLLSVATNRPVGRSEVLSAVGTLGGSVFRIHNENEHLSVSTESLGSGLFVPVSEIKEARRSALSQLLELTRLHEKDLGISTASVLPRLRGEAVQFTQLDAYKINEKKISDNIFEAKINENIELTAKVENQKNENEKINVKKSSSLLQRAKDKKSQKSIEKSLNYDFTDIASASMEAYENSISGISPAQVYHI